MQLITFYMLNFISATLAIRLIEPNWNEDVIPRSAGAVPTPYDQKAASPHASLRSELTGETERAASSGALDTPPISTRLSVPPPVSLPTAIAANSITQPKAKSQRVPEPAAASQLPISGLPVHKPNAQVFAEALYKFVPIPNAESCASLSKELTQNRVHGSAEFYTLTALLSDSQKHPSESNLLSVIQQLDGDAVKAHGDHFPILANFHERVASCIVDVDKQHNIFQRVVMSGYPRTLQTQFVKSLATASNNYTPFLYVDKVGYNILHLAVLSGASEMPNLVLNLHSQILHEYGAAGMNPLIGSVWVLSALEQKSASGLTAMALAHNLRYYSVEAALKNTYRNYYNQLRYISLALQMSNQP